MLDIKFIRQNPEAVREGLRKKKDTFDLDAFLELDRTRKELGAEIEKGYAVQNKMNQELKQLLKGKKDTAVLIEKGKEIKKGIAALQAQFGEIDRTFQEEALKIPNIPHPSVPVGGAGANKIVQAAGQLRKFDFTPVSHIELGQHLDILDFSRAAKLCGSNFSLFKAEGARLIRALINFMLDLHTKEHGYTEVFPPFLANRASMTVTGQLPKLQEDMYRLKDDDYFLIPTAEVPVTNLHRDEILDEDALPLYYTAYTACFRREAGSYGKDTRGLTRVHQFNKVELVKFTNPHDSYNELEKLLADACRIIELLEIPYRVVLLAGGDLSFAAAKCYDIEMYAPGIDRWLEVSSCSNFQDFQARRGNIRYREKESKKLQFVHTLNGSGVALPRLIIALLENHQQKGGWVTLPQALRPYYDGKERIGR